MGFATSFCDRRDGSWGFPGPLASGVKGPSDFGPPLARVVKTCSTFGEAFASLGRLVGIRQTVWRDL